MEDIVFEATLKKAKSKKNEDYYYVSLMLTENLEKKIFLDQAELELLKITYGD